MTIRMPPEPPAPAADPPRTAHPRRQGTGRPHPRRASAWSTATSAPARSTPSRRSSRPHTGVPLDAPHLIGAVSVIFWALMLVVTLKYVILILRADNHGEGGGLALTALAAKAVRRPSRAAQRPAAAGRVRRHAVLWRQRDHARPSRCSARWKGWSCVAPALKPYVVPITVAILVGLFLVQRLGTALRGPLLRADHRAVVRHAGRHRRRAHRAAARHPGRAEPAARLGVPGRARLAPVRRGGRHRAGAHRRRGAVRRHGPLRPASRSSWPGPAWCCPAWR